MTPAEIREARQLLGLTQPKFGQLLHATERTVRMWESGQRNMALATQDLLQRIMTERGLEHNSLCSRSTGLALSLPVLDRHS